MTSSTSVATTIRNLDEDAYRRLKAHAARTRRTIGAELTEAIEEYLAHRGAQRKRRSILQFKPRDLGPGTERLSEEIDRIVYGI